MYVLCNELISNGKDFMQISRLTQLWAIYTLICYSLNVALLIALLQQGKKTKARIADQGTYELWWPYALLLCLFAQICLASCLVYKPKLDLNIYQAMVRDMMNLVICMIYFKMVTNFIIDFRLSTRVNKDGTVDIVGLSETGYELFKFELDDERRQGLFGFDAAQS